MLPQTASPAFEQGDQGCAGSVDRGVMVGLGEAEAQGRPVFVTGQARITTGGHHRDLAVGVAGLRPTLTEGGYRHVHQGRVDGRQVVMAQAELDQPARPIGLDQHIGAAHEVAQSVTVCLGAVQVEHDRPLAPVVGPVIERPLRIDHIADEGSQVTSALATRRLNGDHVGSQLGQDETSAMTPVVTQIEHSIRRQHRQLPSVKRTHRSAR